MKSLMLQSAIASLSILVVFACSRTVKEDSKEGKAAIKSAEEFNDKAFERKSNGENKKALELFEQAHRTLVKAFGEKNKRSASCLDDMATIHMRTGDYKKAKELYRESISILKKNTSSDPELIDSIKRRLATLNALRATNTVCNEPMEPKTSMKSNTDENTNENTQPYFPEITDVQNALGKMNARLTGCIKGDKRPVTMWIVLSGKGRVIRAETRTRLAGTPEAACLEKKVINAGKEMADVFPKFNACFMSLNYPFFLGD